MSGRQILAAAVTGYQRLVSPFLPRACRFAPTCSEYARLAVLEHGVIRGSGLALVRIVRCNPLNTGGYDPPPTRERPAS